jgi:hypothetical protein
MITIHSSHGDLAVDPETGLVDREKSRYKGRELLNVERFDIEEFCVFWDSEPQSGDILDFGLWATRRPGQVTKAKENYEPAELDWRMEIVIGFLLEDLVLYGLADQVGAITTPGELLKLVYKGRAFGASSKV